MNHMQVIFVAFSVMSVRCTSLDTIAAVVSRIYSIYHPKEILLIHPQHVQGADGLLELQKELARKFLIPTRVLTSLKQVDAQALHVLCGEETVQHEILQKPELVLSSGRWLLLLAESVRYEQLLKNVVIPIGAEVMIFQNNSLSEVYRNRPEDKLQKFVLGRWNVQEQLFSYWSDQTLLHRRGDLRGDVLKASTHHLEILSHTDGISSNLLKGLYRIWKALETSLNFRTKYMAPVELVSGSRRENGSWSGTMGMVSRREVDFGLNYFSMSNIRLQAVDFLMPLMTDKLMLFIKERRSEFHVINLLLPFDNKLWCMVAVTMVILTIVLPGCFHIRIRYAGHSDDEDCGLNNSWIIVFASFSHQGFGTTPRFVTGRMLFLTLHMTSLLLFLGYCANFMSCLTVNQPSLPFKDFQGILNDGTYKVYVNDKSADMDLFEYAQDPVLQAIRHKLVVPVRMTPQMVRSLQRRMCAGEHIAAAWVSTHRSYLPIKSPCNIVPVPNAYFTNAKSFIVPKGSRYRKLFGQSVNVMARSGILALNVPSSLPAKDVEVNLDPPYGTDLQQVSAIFGIWIAGVFLSLVILLAEIGIHKQNYNEDDVTSFVKDPKLFRTSEVTVSPFTYR